MEYDENKRQLERAQYEQARNWQDGWHAFTHALASMWSKLAACFLCSPIKNHLTKEAVSLLPLLSLGGWLPPVDLYIYHWTPGALLRKLLLSLILKSKISKSLPVSLLLPAGPGLGPPAVVGYADAVTSSNLLSEAGTTCVSQALSYPQVLSYLQ